MSGFDADLSGHIGLEFGEGVHVHESGLEGIVRAYVDVHMQCPLGDPEPQPLQAGRVVDGRIVPDLPGDRLCPAGVGHGLELLDSGGDLVENAVLRHVVGEQPLVVRVLPLASRRIDPVVVDAVEHFGAVFLEVFQPGGKRAVYPRLVEGPGDVDQGGDVSAVRVVGLVVLSGKALALLPASDDGPFPGQRQRLIDNMYRFHTCASLRETNRRPQANPPPAGHAT